ncbi:MAG: hypothetical protein KatS3mg011_0179 [Acidimicrobiia bacterium]|nr:MAG: hypothetical protein KatS3mg011_0179 [Acidimicrobiia bacterium]
MAQTVDARQALPERELVPSPPVDLGAAVKWGLIAGMTAVFVSAIGMVQAFEVRSVVVGVDLGYLVLFGAALVFGYAAARPGEQLEGFLAPERGVRNVAAGLIAGLVGGAVLWLFVLLIGAVDIRSVFPSVSPQLRDLLTFGRGAGFAAAALIGGFGLVGALGGGIPVLPERIRAPLVNALAWVLAFGLFEDLFAQIFRGAKVPFLEDLLYQPGGGLSLVGALIVFVLFFAVYLSTASRRETVRSRIATMSPSERRRWVGVGLVVAIVILAVLPQILGNFLSEVFDLAGIFLMMALGLNIVVGYAGLLDLGYVAFFAVGAYTTAVLTSPGSPRWSPEMTFVAALPFIVLAAAMAGIMVGTPVLRMRGDYLAIVTLGFGEIARLLFLSDWLKPYFGGAQGILQIPPLELGPLTFRSSLDFFYPIYAFVLVFAYVSWALQNSRIGRGWMAMREDEPVAEVMGVDVVKAKLTAFVIGAILASFGGALFAHKIGSVFPHSFQILVSIVVLVIIIVGGIGSIPGVVVGALILVGAPELLREFAEFRYLIYGVLLIFMMLKKPEGFIPSRQRARELHQEEMMQDAWLRKEEEAAAAAGS